MPSHIKPKQDMRKYRKVSRMCLNAVVLEYCWICAGKQGNLGGAKQTKAILVCRHICCMLYFDVTYTIPEQTVPVTCIGVVTIAFKNFKAQAKYSFLKCLQQSRNTVCKANPFIYNNYMYLMQRRRSSLFS